MHIDIQNHPLPVTHLLLTNQNHPLPVTHLLLTNQNCVLYK